MTDEMLKIRRILRNISDLSPEGRQYLQAQLAKNESSTTPITLG